MRQITEVYESLTGDTPDRLKRKGFGSSGVPSGDLELGKPKPDIWQRQDDVYIDGDKVGHHISKAAEKEAARPPADGQAIDPNRLPERVGSSGKN